MALKDDIRPLEGSALDRIGKLQGRRFRWRTTDTEALGVIAQEVEKVVPEAVVRLPNGVKGVDALALIGTLIEAIKELKNRG